MEEKRYHILQDTIYKKNKDTLRSSLTLSLSNKKLALKEAKKLAKEQDYNSTYEYQYVVYDSLKGEFLDTFKKG